MHKKSLFAIILSMSLILGLSACDNGKEPAPTDSQPEPTVSDTPSTETPETKYMLVDTEEYSLTFDMLGTWVEYAGNSEIRESAQAVLTSSSETANDSVFFYVLINKYDDTSEETLKDKIVENIKAKFSSVEFESITDSSSDNQIVTSIYTMSQDNTTIKNYQYTVIQDGYQISFIYSAPTLIYNNQKGYIKDMIDSFEFSLK